MKKKIAITLLVLIVGASEWLGYALSTRRNVLKELWVGDYTLDQLTEYLGRPKWAVRWAAESLVHDGLAEIDGRKYRMNITREDDVREMLFAS